MICNINYIIYIMLHSMLYKIQIIMQGYKHDMYDVEAKSYTFPTVCSAGGQVEMQDLSLQVTTHISNWAMSPLRMELPSPGRVLARVALMLPGALKSSIIN
jgi:hypothetical protein